MEGLFLAIRITEFLNALTIVLSVIGGIVALVQWNDSNKLKRAEYVNNLFSEFYRYQVERIIKNKKVQEYLYNIYHNAQHYKNEMSFSYLFKYGQKNNFFDKEFYDSLSNKYPAYLSFREKLNGEQVYK